MTVATAAVGAVIALRSVERNIATAREVARRKATLDLIEKFESSEHYRTLTDTFSTVRRLATFAHLVKPLDAHSKMQRGRILDYLNHYELVSIGIRNGILDADIYRRWMQSAFLRDWKAAAGWVQSVRCDNTVTGKHGYDTAPFENYESMACEWSRHPWWLPGAEIRDAEVRRLTANSPKLEHIDAPSPDEPLAPSADY